jgi:hypothetical protein
MPNPTGVNQWSGGGGGHKPSAADHAKVQQARVRADAHRANEHHDKVMQLHQAGRHVEARALSQKGY